MGFGISYTGVEIDVQILLINQSNQILWSKDEMNYLILKKIKFLKTDFSMAPWALKEHPLDTYIT